MKRNSEITAAQYLYPDYDTAYDWDHEEVRDDVWFDCDAKQFLTFDEVLSIAGESTGLYRLQAKHEANTDIDGFIDKYLYGTKIYPVWFEEVTDYVAADFGASSYNDLVEDEDDPIDALKKFVYETYAGVTPKVKRALSAENDWWFKEVLKGVDINYTDGLDWSESAMLNHGAELYTTYGPGKFDDMTDYDYESHQLYQKSIGASSDIMAASNQKLCFLLEDRSGYVSRKPTIWIGTIDYLVRAFSYTLEVGESWQHERGNHKINRNPKNINSLVKNLQWAKDNAAANGYSGTYYTALTAEEVNSYDEEDARWAGEINGERVSHKPTPEQLGL
jgi:hypothetical protein